MLETLKLFGPNYVGDRIDDTIFAIALSFFNTGRWDDARKLLRGRCSTPSWRALMPVRKADACTGGLEPWKTWRRVLRVYTRRLLGATHGAGTAGSLQKGSGGMSQM